MQRCGEPHPQNRSGCLIDAGRTHAYHFDGTDTWPVEDFEPEQVHKTPGSPLELAREIARRTRQRAGS
jgi:hypothetical protein